MSGKAGSAMSAKNMDVFSLRDSVVGDYKKFATSFTTIHAPDIATQIREIYDSKRYWPEPLIQINPNYRRDGTVQKLVNDGSLHPACAALPPPWSRRRHRPVAFGIASPYRK